MLQMATIFDGTERRIADEISDVRMGPIEGNFETFTFMFRGVKHIATQKGRLRDLCIGHSEKSDNAIASLAIIDGLAVPIE